MIVHQLTKYRFWGVVDHLVSMANCTCAWVEVRALPELIYVQTVITCIGYRFWSKINRG